MVSNLQDRIGRVEGVGDTNVFGSQFAMRIWLDPARMASYKVTAGDVITSRTFSTAIGGVTVCCMSISPVRSPAQARPVLRRARRRQRRGATRRARPPI